MTKIVIEFRDGSRREIGGTVAGVLAPAIINADKLLTNWEYPIQLVMRLSYDPASKNLRLSAEAEI